jgi:coenzyme F420-reducing hydrogenase delta subunit/NAD-dependent dihydropyrimidine dehydrogenase PreA subunit
MPVLPSELRIQNFEPYELGLDEKTAIFEAGRCLSCGLGAQVAGDKCAACLTCKRVCPYEVPLVEGLAHMPVEGCQACGICAASCPACAITVDSLYEHKIKEAFTAQQGKSPVVIFTGQENCFDDLKSPDIMTVLIRVPTIGAVQLEWLLSAFENGAAGVAVLGSRETSRRHYDGDGALKGMLARAKELMTAIGLAPERLFYCIPEEDENLATLLETFCRKLQLELVNS